MTLIECEFMLPKHQLPHSVAANLFFSPSLAFVVIFYFSFLETASTIFSLFICNTKASSAKRNTTGSRDNTHHANKMAITEKEKTYMNERFLSFVDSIYQLTDKDGNDFSFAFHALPLRSNIEYYKVIKNPMSYSKVKMAAKHGRYVGANHLECQILQ